MAGSARKSLLATVMLTLLATVVLILAGGCAAVPAVLVPTEREACHIARGVDFRFVICVEHGRPHTLGDDCVAPNLWIRLDSLDTANGDLLWTLNPARHVATDVVVVPAVSWEIPTEPGCEG